MKQRNILKGKPLNFNVGIQKWYVKELLKLVDSFNYKKRELDFCLNSLFSKLGVGNGLSSQAVARQVFSLL